jgi:hypothetical protein
MYSAPGMIRGRADQKNPGATPLGGNGLKPFEKNIDKL